MPRLHGGLAHVLGAVRLSRVRCLFAATASGRAGVPVAPCTGRCASNEEEFAHADDGEEAFLEMSCASRSSVLGCLAMFINYAYLRVTFPSVVLRFARRAAGLRSAGMASVFVQAGALSLGGVHRFFGGVRRFSGVLFDASLRRALEAFGGVPSGACSVSPSGACHVSSPAAAAGSSGAASCAAGVGSCAVVGCLCFEDYWGEDFDSFSRGVPRGDGWVSRRRLGGGFFCFGGASRARLGDIGILSFCVLAVVLLASALVSTMVLSGAVEAKPGGGGLRLTLR